MAVSIWQIHIKEWQRELQKKSYKLMHFAKLQKVSQKLLRNKSLQAL